MKEKKLFSIGKIAKMTGLEIHTIRFWTEEFAEYIKFEIGKGERRYYSESAIQTFEKINNLIHKEGIRIKAIKEKKLLLENTKSPSNLLESVKKELLEMRQLLNQI